MDDMPMGGIPWLTYPLELHSSRDPGECELTPEQCYYKSSHWRNWYIADHVYALPTVYFCIAVVAIFAIPYGISLLWPSFRRHPALRRVTAATRYAAYRGFTISKLGWYSPPLGVMLLGLVGVFFFFCMTLAPKPYYWPNGVEITFGDSPPLATRAGWMSLALLPFVLASSSKFNLITLVTGVSHEKIQPFHRWAAYAMFVLALVHTFPFIVFNIWKGRMMEQWSTNFDYWTGVAAIVPQAYLTFFSVKVIRDRFYEFFKATHLFVAVVFAVFFFIHCGYTLTSWDYFIAAGVVYFVPFFGLLLRTFFEHGLGHKARLEFEHHGSLIIRMKTSPHFHWTPGQHIFLRFSSPKLGVHSLTSHPFTICSLPTAGEAIFHVRPHKGITARLASVAQSGRGTTVRVWLDGPYGGMGNRRLSDYDRQLIIAGGSGVGFTLPLIEELMQKSWKPTVDREGPSSQEKSVQQSGPVIVVAVRTVSMRAWFLREVDELVQRYTEIGCIPKLHVHCHVTDESTSGAASPDSASSMDVETQRVEGEKSQTNAESSHHAARCEKRLEKGRPDLPQLIKESAANSTTSLAAAVCGPASMMHDVRNAVAETQMGIIKGQDGSGSQDIFLHCEHFGW